MKKILFALASVALLFATSCKKEQNINPAVDVPEGSFLATIDNGANPQNAPRVTDGMGTMTTIDANNFVIWETGDEISINGSTYTTTSTPGSSAVFSGGNASGSKFHAFYPATIAGTGAAGTLPAAQTYVSGKVSNLPMYACSEDNQLTFNNICAVLKITIPECVNAATSIEVSSSDKAMNGAFTVTDNAAVMTSTSPSDAEKKVTIAKSDESTFTTGEVVYIAVPANTYSNLKVEFFNEQTSMWQKTLTTCTLDVNKVYNINITPSDIPVNCFHFTATGNVRVGMEHGKNAQNVNLQYNKYTASTGQYSGWQDVSLTDSTTIVLANGDKMYYKAKTTNDRLMAKGQASQRYGHRFVSKWDGTLSVSGNIMYLLNGSNPATTLSNTNNDYAFCNLFSSMKNLKDASQLNLPATTLSNHCYHSMFNQCSILENAPALPAETLAPSCYHSMFQSCTTLTTAPALPATTLADSCYMAMFALCTSLTTAPILRATTLMQCCYRSMFNACAALTEVTMLATSIPSGTDDKCLGSWLNGAGKNAEKTSSTHLVHVASGMTTNSVITSSLTTSGDDDHRWTAVNP